MKTKDKTKKTPWWAKDSNGREKGSDYHAYSRDLKLRVSIGQVGSGMICRP